METPVLEAGDLERLASYARMLEAHCGCPHCVEWVKDGQGEIQVVQARHLPPADNFPRPPVDMARPEPGPRCW